MAMTVWDIKSREKWMMKKIKKLGFKHRLLVKWLSLLYKFIYFATLVGHIQELKRTNKAT